MPEKNNLCIKLKKAISINRKSLDILEVSYMQKIPETPEYIVMEWELLNLIISYTFITYSENDKVSFTTNEIKKYFREVIYENFNKVYGKNGLHALLLYRNGVQYNTTSDTWNIFPNPFLSGLSEEYKKDEYLYGKDFDKPWIKNLRDIK